MTWPPMRARTNLITAQAVWIGAIHQFVMNGSAETRFSNKKPSSALCAQLNLVKKSEEFTMSYSKSAMDLRANALDPKSLSSVNESIVANTVKNTMA
eukprot:CAMPEP_0115152792 /NCGR_PEP_ID=MMETSP0227-20121206/66355_2 /TAXON_ID=89957 /ORGANISM="Polarella glacialis, Strain CCMP 1383" /LENGTH=96 /DNA_ID=CAMNT_0002563435 /DNA_START=228 /DNA_END=518 /DNA_ORIENTATION=-